MDPDLKAKFQRTLDHLKSELSSVRTGRANPSLVSDIPVTAYGARMKIVELATVTSPDSHLLVVAPWDKSIVGDVSKGIMEANVGLQPIIDGDTVKVPIPPLSEERRLEYIKLANQKLEEGKVSIRSVRHDAQSDLKRKKESREISEDEFFRLEKILQDEVDKMIVEIDTIGKAKEAELMQV